MSHAAHPAHSAGPKAKTREANVVAATRRFARSGGADPNGAEETVLLDLEYSLAALRNPRKRATLPGRLQAQQTQSKDVPAEFEALNAAQGAHPPFESAELLRLAAILARGIIRALAETPDTLTPGAIETLFSLLAGGEPAATALPSRRRRPRSMSPRVTMNMLRSARRGRVSHSELPIVARA